MKDTTAATAASARNRRRRAQDAAATRKAASETEPCLYCGRPSIGSIDDARLCREHFIDANNRHRRYENCTIEVEIDANGWPTLTVFPSKTDDRPVEHLSLWPTGGARWIKAAHAAPPRRV